MDPCLDTPATRTTLPALLPCGARILVAMALLAGSMTAATGATLLRDLNAAGETLIEKVNPAVVQILVSAYGPGDGDPAGGALLSRRRGSGSGVILDPSGYIVTNAHVVAGTDRVRVRLNGIGPATGRSILKPRGRLVAAEIVGVDPGSDLAVIKIEATELPTLELGDSDDVRPGHLVYAFGSPFELENSVSMGVVSSIARQFRPEDPMIYIQTDATINPGNSGGPLVDVEGRVVGINTMILSKSGGSEGLGFAVPSNIVANVYKQIRATGRVRRGEIGVHAQTITPTMAAALELPRDRGVILGDVVPGGPGELAGLRVGDVIVTMDGKPMENGRQFDVNLFRREVGQKVTLAVVRGREELTVQVPVVEAIDDPHRFAGLVRPDEHLVPELGILAITLDRDLGRRLPGLRRPSGVLVALTSGESPSGDGHFLPGDVIHTINRQSIASIESLREVMSGLGTGDAVAVQVERRGRLEYIAFDLE